MNKKIGERIKKMALKKKNIDYSLTDKTDKFKEIETSQEEKYNMKDFRVDLVLGVGAFGQVVKAFHQPSQTFYALKAIDKLKVTSKRKFDHLLNEKNILLPLNHSCIVKLEGIVKDTRFLYFIMEFVSEGELFYHLRVVKNFLEAQVCFFGSQVVLALEYLHDLKIIHRDIKPENIIVDVHGFIKLTDFGFAKKVITRTYTWCGTPEYIAPEIIRMKGYGKSVDWWTVGVLLFELRTGHPPFEAENHVDLYKKIYSNEFYFPAIIGSPLRRLIEGLLVADPTRRLGMSLTSTTEIMEHDFFAGVDWGAVKERKVIAPYKPNKAVHMMAKRDLLQMGRFSLTPFKKQQFTQSIKSELIQLFEEF